VYLRIPAWVERGILTVEDEPIQEVGGGSYLALKRFWQAATEVRLELEMPVRALLSRPEIAANRGQVAFARGPLIYCAEQADSEISVEDLCVSGKMDAILEASEAAWHPDFLGGCHVLRMPTFRFRFLEENGGWPYFNPTSQTIEMVCATMIPYYARANRNASSQWVTLIPMSQ
jgi:hypothetical protein